MKMKRYSEAEQKFRIIIDVCSQIKQYPSYPESVHQMEAPVLERLGNSLFMQKRLGEAYLMYTKALAIYEKKLLHDDVGQARCLQGLGDVLQFIGDDVDANKYYRQAETSYEAAGRNEEARYCRESYSVRITRLAGWVTGVCEDLKKEAGHPDAEVRKQAAYLLGNVSAQTMDPSEPELPVEILKELLEKESDPQVRIFAQESLQKLSERKILRL